MLLYKLMSSPQKTTLRRDLLNRLSEGRRLMGYDMVLRSPRSGVKKNHLNTSPVELHFMVLRERVMVVLFAHHLLSLPRRHQVD